MTSTTTHNIITGIKKLIPFLFYHEINNFIKKNQKTKNLYESVLLGHLRHSDNSAYGKRYKFSQIKNIKQFKSILPIIKYEDIQNYVNQVFYGNTGSLLNASVQIKYFNITSGTTGPKKIIPITNRELKHINKSIRIWGIKALYDHPNVIGSYFAPLVSSGDLFRSPLGIHCGDAGGLIAYSPPSIISSFYPIPRDVYMLQDNDIKFYLYLRYLLPYKNLKFLLTPSPATYVALLNMCNIYKASLIKDIYDGTCNIQHHLLKNFKFKKNINRARELEKIISDDIRTFTGIWPNLELVSCWIGGNFKHYIPILKQLFGNHCAIRELGFIASEGYFSIAYKDYVPYGMLNLLHYYFEFVPEKDYPLKNHSYTLDVYDLQENKKYYIIITNACGLFRYDMQDLINFKGFENGVPIIEFINKASHFIDISGEKLSSWQITDSIKEVINQFSIEQVNVKEFFIYPKINFPSHYVLVIENNSIINSDIEKSFILQLDEILQSKNIVYKEHRESEKLGPIELRQIPSHVFKAIKDKYCPYASSNIEQFKMPRIINDPDVNTLINKSINS